MCQHCVGCNPECPECHPAWLEQPAARRCQNCQRLNPVALTKCIRCGQDLEPLSGQPVRSPDVGYCQYVGRECEQLCSMARVRHESDDDQPCVRE